VGIPFDHHSLWVLFFLAFAAATILPVGSEWLLILLVADGYSLPLSVVTATIGNFLGSCTTYLLGIWGSGFIITKVFRISVKDLDRATNLYRKWGVWSLFLSWLPVVGDPLCLAAGVFRTRFALFSLIVFTAKAARYVFVALASSAIFIA
jgi:membrane protein YqaA with SNARE-associated domain